MVKKSPFKTLPGAEVLQTALKRYTNVLPNQEFITLSACAKTPAPPALRTNTLKIETLELANQLKSQYAWQFEPVPFCSSGLRPVNLEGRFSTTIEHRLGMYYIQDAASMLPAECFDFTSMASPLVLDMAASPGGKTTHLTALTHDKGMVIANDASRSRLSALRVVLQNWGALNQAVTSYPGEQFGSAYPGLFDAVLLDAPCSMEGLRTSFSHSPRAITPGERSQLASRQKHLLESALRAVKPGGQVVYSTCSLAPEEDEAVLDDVLRRFSRFIEVTPLPFELPPNSATLPEYAGQHFAESIRNATRLWPHIFDTAGFFTALLQKISPLPGESELSKRNPREHHMPEIFLTSKQTHTVQAAVTDTFGLNLAALMEEYFCTLVQRGADTWLFPYRLLEIPNLNAVSAGILLGKQLPNSWLPSHEFAARIFARAQAGKVTLPETFVNAWLNGRDAQGFTLQGVKSGSVVLVFDESKRYIGRGKVLTGRLRNLLPARLF